MGAAGVGGGSEVRIPCREGVIGASAVLHRYSVRETAWKQSVLGPVRPKGPESSQGRGHLPSCWLGVPAATCCWGLAGGTKG